MLGFKARHDACVRLDLSEGDDGYPMRWRLLKSHFSRHSQKNEFISDSRLRKNERGIYPKGTSDNSDLGDPL